MHITDGYGSGLDRTDVCYDPSKSVTVMITDSCKWAGRMHHHAPAVSLWQPKSLERTSVYQLQFAGMQAYRLLSYSTRCGKRKTGMILSRQTFMLRSLRVVAGPCNYPPNWYSNK